MYSGGTGSATIHLQEQSIVHRFFISPQDISGQFVTFPEDTVHQISRVLRMQPGDRIIVLDNSGWERVVELDDISRHDATGRVLEKRIASGEPNVKITLYQSMLKKSNFELVLQKCTELGVVSFVPIISSRTVVGSLGAISDNKWSRWERIITEAAEQCRRGRRPALNDAQMFSHAVSQAQRRGGTMLIPWEEEGSRSLNEALYPNESGERPFSVSVFVGPEGGFEEEEVALAKEAGAVVVTLGPRILRAETAAIAATATVLYELGEWDAV